MILCGRIFYDFWSLTVFQQHRRLATFNNRKTRAVQERARLVAAMLEHHGRWCSSLKSDLADLPALNGRTVITPGVLCATLESGICIEPNMAWRFFSWVAEDPAFVHSARTWQALGKFAASTSFDSTWSLICGWKQSPINEKTNTAHYPSFFSSLIKGYCRAYKWKEAIAVLHSMPDFDCQADVGSYNAILSVLSFVDARKSKEIFQHMIDVGCKPDTKSFNFLIAAVVREGRAEDGFPLLTAILDNECEANSTTFEIMCSKLVKGGRFEEAMLLLEHMALVECPPSLLTYNMIVSGLAKTSCGTFTGCTLSELIDKVFKSNTGNFNVLVHWLLREKRATEAFELCERMYVVGGCYPDIATYNALICGLVKAGEGDLALKIVRKILDRKAFLYFHTGNNVVCWLLKKNRSNDAVEVTKRLISFDCELERQTYIELACSLINSKRHAQDLATVSGERHTRNLCRIARFLGHEWTCFETSLNFLKSCLSEEGKEKEAHKLAERMKAMGLQIDYSEQAESNIG